MKPKAIISLNVWVNCPKCGDSIDLTKDDDGTFLNPLFNNEWDYLKGYPVYCNCGHEFEIEEVQY